MTRMAGMDDGVLALQGRDLLQRYTRVAIVGLSDNPSRPSYRVAVHLIAYGEMAGVTHIRVRDYSWIIRGGRR